MRRSISCPHCGSVIDLPQTGEPETDPAGNESVVFCNGCKTEFSPVADEQTLVTDNSDDDGAWSNSASSSSDSSDPHQEPSIEPIAPMDFGSVPSDEHASLGGPAIVFSIDDEDSIEDFAASEDRASLDAKGGESNEDAITNDTVETSSDEEIALELEAEDEWETGNSDSPIESPSLDLSEDESVPEKTDDGAEAESDSQWQMLSSAGVRRQRREASAIRKILPPILGGLAAFPIATAIMWYGFGKDIGNTGQIVAEYAPWLVPSKLQKNRWQRSANSTRENNANRESQIGNGVRPSTGPTASGPSLSNLPKLNRDGGSSGLENANEPTKPAVNDKSEPLTASNPPVVSSSKTPSERQTKSSEQTSAPENDTNKPSISSLIASMRKYQDGWYGTPKDQQIQLLKDYYGTAQQLSEQAASLKGRSASVWRKELESLAREVLADKSFKAVMQRGPIGKLPGISAAEEGAFVATVIELGESNEPDANQVWTVQEKWKGASGELKIEAMPGAWRAGSANLPALCLVLGRIVRHDADATSSADSQDSNTESEPSGNLQLQVHALLPLR